MILSLSIPALLLVGVVGYIVYTIACAVFDPLRSVPGPFLARFTRLWWLIDAYKGAFEKTNIELHKKYGPIVRLAPGLYSVDDVDAAKVIYAHGNAFPKNDWYSAWMPLDPKMDSLFAQRNVHRHSGQRRKFSSFYSMSSLVGYEPFVDNCTKMLVDRFHEIAAHGKVVNLRYWMQCYAFDVIGEITFANRFGFLDQGEDKDGVFTAIDQRGFYSTFVGMFPWLHTYLYPLLPTTGGHGYVLNYTLNQITERQKALKDPKNSGRDGPADIMTRILQAHEDNPENVTRTDLITMCMSNIGAGSDTTAITISSILYHSLRYPQTFAKLREEIDLATKEGRASDPITFKEAQQLPYLQAVIKEALRCHPVTGLPMQRLTPPEGATIAGTFIPGGSTVGISAWVAQRNQAVFGQDADRWRPERWLEPGAAETDRYMLAFGMGSRTCIGKNISLLEMAKLVPQLVRNFDFELDMGPNPELVCENRWFVKMMNFEGRVLQRKM